LSCESESGLMAAAVETSPSLSVSVPKLVVSGEHLGSGGSQNWDVGPDDRFLLIKPVTAEASIQIVLNWREELKRLVPKSSVRISSPLPKEGRPPPKSHSFLSPPL